MNINRPFVEEYIHAMRVLKASDDTIVHNLTRFFSRKELEKINYGFITEFFCGAGIYDWEEAPDTLQLKARLCTEAWDTVTTIVRQYKDDVFDIVIPREADGSRKNESLRFTGDTNNIVGHMYPMEIYNAVIEWYEDFDKDIEKLAKLLNDSVDPPLKTYRVPVVWQMWGAVYVDATSEEEAIDLALDSEAPLPDGEYVDGSEILDDTTPVQCLG